MLLKKRKLLKINEAKKLIPESSGVYIFWKNRKTPIYIGKALNLKYRIHSYYTKTIEGKTRKMFNTAKYLSYIKVNSEIESLLLEAKLIGNIKPKYNVIQKDDKSPLYIKITNDQYPLIKTARKSNTSDAKYLFGPFPSSGKVKSLLKLLRKIIPFSDHKIGKRVCIESQIGLCSPCPNLIETLNDNNKTAFRKVYIKNIYLIKQFLDGEINHVRDSLYADMLKLSSLKHFENAQILKKRIELINYITQPINAIKEYLENPNLISQIRKRELDALKTTLKKDYGPVSLTRIECYDVAHLSGNFTTASMVVFKDGEKAPSCYRHFRLKDNIRNDLTSLKEVIERRTKYFIKWGRPDLVIVDGGCTQVKTFLCVLNEYHIPVIGISKREERLIIPVQKDSDIKFKSIRLKNGPLKNIILRIRNESHRFARRYHYILIKKALTDI